MSEAERREKNRLEALFLSFLTEDSSKLPLEDMERAKEMKIPGILSKGDWDARESKAEVERRARNTAKRRPLFHSYYDELNNVWYNRRKLRQLLYDLCYRKLKISHSERVAILEGLLAYKRDPLKLGPSKSWVYPPSSNPRKYAKAMDCAIEEMIKQIRIEEIDFRLGSRLPRRKVHPAVMRKYRAKIDSLTPRQKEIFCLRVEYGMTYLEIGRKLGIDRTTVRDHFNAARKQINIAPSVAK